VGAFAKRRLWREDALDGDERRDDSVQRGGCHRRPAFLHRSERRRRYSRPSRPLRAHHHQSLHEHRVQRDDHAESDESPEAGGRRPGGAPVRAAR